MEFVKDYEEVHLTLPDSFPEYLEIDSVLENSVECNKSYQKTDNTESIRCKISRSRILADGDDVKKVYEVTLKMNHNTHQFLPGDTISIFPKNLSNEIQIILDRLGIVNPNTSMQVKIKENTQKKKPKIPNHIPDKFCVIKLFEECLDIRTIPKKLFLRALVDYTEQPIEKRFLEILCSTEGTSQYNQYIVGGALKFIELLSLLKSCKPKLSTLLEHLPRLQPRSYSIANDPTDNDELKFVFSSINIDTICNGLTTKMLEDLISKNKAETEEIYLDIFPRKRSGFCYALEDLSTNIIMIGPGTAVSPFLSFLEFRKRNKETSALGHAILITGCRYKDKNALYCNELYKFESEKILDRLANSYSRDENCKFKYVQDQILENSQEILNLMNNPNTKCFVCGDDKIIKNVEGAFIQCLNGKTAVGETPNVNLNNTVDSPTILKQWKKTSKFITDLWF